MRVINGPVSVRDAAIKKSFIEFQILRLDGISR